MVELLAGRPVPRPLKKSRKRTVQASVIDPEDITCKRLHDEFIFLQWWRKQNIDEEARKKAYEVYLKECEANRLLLECECCYTENLPEETIQCAGGHLFCKTCAQRYVESRLAGDTGVPQLRCPSTDGCQALLTRSELLRVLSQDLYDKYEKLLEKASIEAVKLHGGLEGLEQCPFCDFAMEMNLPPEENRIFVCLNEQCGKESCRLCKEENHIPFPCEKKEKKAQTSYRLTMEESMTDALIRECPTCKEKGVVSRFVKETGCNKMTCPKCKGWVCYQCCAAIPKKVGYGHFCQHARNPGQKCKKCDKCDLWTGSEKDLEKLEADRVLQAGLKAREDYQEQSGKDLEDPDVLVSARNDNKESMPRKEGTKRPGQASPHGFRAKAKAKPAPTPARAADPQRPAWRRWAGGWAEGGWWS